MGQQDMTRRERQRLVDAFLSLDGMRDRGTRNAFLDMLKREIGHSLWLRRHDEDRLDVYGIVDGCLSHPGALHRLVDLLRDFYRGSFQMTELDYLVHLLVPPPLLELEERAVLYQLLSGVRSVAVTAMYREAVTAFGPELTEDPSDVVAVVQQLEDVNAAPGGLPPLIRFVELLAKEAAGPVAAGLRAWVDRLASRLELAHPEMRQLRSSGPGAPPRDPRSYLMIQLQEDSIEPERYLMSAWWQQGEEGSVESLQRDDEPRALHQVAEQVDDLLTRIPDLAAGAVRDYVLEFILPRHLLSHTVDQWRTAVKLKFPRRLGIEHAVVVRSLERMRSRRMHHQWRRKWRWLMEGGHPGDAGAIHWVHRPGRTDPEALLSELVFDDKPVCLVLLFPPKVDRDLGDDELAAGLHAGIPIMLWSRDDRAPEKLEAELQKLIGSRSLHELPQLVLQLRRDAVRPGAAEDHLGLHLTLLWDDPYRIPEPYVRLTAPM